MRSQNCINGKPNCSFENTAALSNFPKALSGVFGGENKVYWQDMSDHITRVNESTKSYLDTTDSLFNLYFSMVGMRTNRIMQTLTVITLVFLPLTLLAGIYGMNFKHMPELNWTYGYPILIGCMILVGLLILWFSKHKKMVLKKDPPAMRGGLVNLYEKE
ncbi:hypothetical protein HC823_00050 [Candidatus Gracilibacteria bacterium]|nr:hypothetical protein [Candidatus Gracilibacteria bacterium]